MMLTAKRQSLALKRQLATRAAAALVAAMCAAGCDLVDPSRNCGDEARDTADFSTPFTAPQPELAQINGTQVKFAWSTLVSGVCSQGSHADTKVEFNMFVNTGVPEPPGLTVTGNVFTAVLLQPHTTIVGPATPGLWFGAVNDIGLKQANADGGAASISNELVVSFTSSGNLATDRATAANFIRNVEIVTSYLKPK